MEEMTKQKSKVLKFLVVDDNEVSRLLLYTVFGQMGYSADQVDNGKDACKMASKNSYDIIMMDLQMPDMDGVEATEHMRSKGVTTPIVAMLANNTESDKSRALRAGIRHFISKPIYRDKLERQLRDRIFPDVITS
jgi:CheY-like chemotaxis protein